MSWPSRSRLSFVFAIDMSAAESSSCAVVFSCFADGLSSFVGVFENSYGSRFGSEDVGGHRFAFLLLCDHLDGLVILVVSFGVCSSPFLREGEIYPDTKWKSKTEEVSTAANCFAG